MTSWRRTVRVSRDLSHYIPDPDTRAFIGRVFRAWGVEWAAVLTREIAEGVLIDCGPSVCERQEAMPLSPGASGGPDTVRSEEQGRKHLRLF
jgi:hypothetical protein